MDNLSEMKNHVIWMFDAYTEEVTIHIDIEADKWIKENIKRIKEDEYPEFVESVANELARLTLEEVRRLEKEGWDV